MRKNKIIISLLLAVILSFGLIGYANAAELTTSSVAQNTFVTTKQSVKLTVYQKKIINKINKNQKK